MADHIEPSEPLAKHRRTRSAGFRWVRATRSGRMRLIVLVACLCVAAAGVSVAVFSGSSQAHHLADAGNGQVASPAPSARVSSSTITTGHMAPSSGTAKSVPQLPPRLTRKILRWKAGPGGTALSAVEAQMGTAMQAVGMRLYATTRLACVRLISAVNTAQSGPPIPEAPKERLYARALSGLSRAAKACRTAISIATGGESVEAHVNHTLLNHSRAEFAAMSKELYRATGEIQALGSTGT